MAGATLRGIAKGIGHTLYGGVSSSEFAPYSFPLSIGQFPYNIDYKYAEQFGFEPVQPLRQQQDQRDTPGEHSYNPEGLWRRSTDSWHLGAGQRCSDRDGSEAFRFDNSTGMDIWTKYHLGLLHDTDQKLSSANTNLRFAVAGTFLYLTNGTAVSRTSNVDLDTPTFTALTGAPPGTAPSSIASDGFNVWTAHGSAGIWKTNTGLTAWAGAAHITGTATLVAYVRGRVLAASANSVWDITVAAQGGGGVALGGAGAPLLFTHPNTGFTWTCFAEGRNAIYMGGYAGDKSLIYKAVIKADGTGLDAPVVAAEFEGEQIESLYGYLGPFIFMGVGLQPGWRFAQVNNNGDLNIGARVSTPLPVRCFEGQENFIWWGYSNYSSTQTGLGRLNVQEFGDPGLLVPAYASDLMATTQNEVLSVVTFNGIRVFTVSGVGVFATHHSRNLVPSGTLDTGEITYNTNQDKIGMYVDVVQIGEGGSHGFYISVDDGSFLFIGEHEEHHESFQVGQITGRTFELRIELKRDGTTPTLGQQLGSWTFSSVVIPAVTRVWRLPLLISRQVTDLDGNDFPFDPWAALDDLAKLQKSKNPTQLKIGPRSYPAVILADRWRIDHLDDLLQGIGFTGTCLVDVQVLQEEF